MAPIHRLDAHQIRDDKHCSMIAMILIQKNSSNPQILVSVFKLCVECSQVHRESKS
jgi:hypothetical protein